ncbi:DUF899 family protein [Streptomyces sp. NPDC085946]|uniref:DUF899 family protein n=1 Tax=Streptomyces sp. NPDC085946 TaxID=3365744 RepID=UPI0037CDCB16
MPLPEIVSRERWRAAREGLPAEEKAVTRARDALNAERRLPVAEVGKELVERSGLGCFLRDRDRAFRTCSTDGRGLDGLGSATGPLGLTALGRQEEWEEPKGRAATFGAPGGSEHARYHDECDD